MSRPTSAPPHPVGVAGGEVLLLPDRNVGLDPLDAVAARLERLRAMRRGTRDDDGDLSDVKVSRAVMERGPAHRPSLEQLGRDLAEARFRELLVGLVAEARHVSGVGTLPHGPDE